MAAPTCRAAGAPRWQPRRPSGSRTCPTPSWRWSGARFPVCRCRFASAPGCGSATGEALVPQGTVLAVHELQRGDRSGYRQRRSARDGALVVVSGGTAHGVALQAPTPAASVRQRVVAAGTGVLEAGGRSLSPFSVGGRQRWFAEPPHMQVSLVRLPAGVPVPAVGDLLPCAVRLTTATFDRVLGLD